MNYKCNPNRPNCRHRLQQLPHPAGPLPQALICRNHGAARLPEPLDSLVARFLNGGQPGPLNYYWPPPLGGSSRQQVVEVVRGAFRQPVSHGCLPPTCHLRACDHLLLVRFDIATGCNSVLCLAL